MASQQLLVLNFSAVATTGVSRRSTQLLTNFVVVIDIIRIHINRTIFADTMTWIQL